MAICKRCNATIPDGTEYCGNCLDEEMLKNESYLDSLLNSVQNSSPDVDGIYKKKNVDKAGDKEKATAEDDMEQASFKAQSDDYVDYTVDMEDFADLFETLDMDDSLHTEELVDTDVNDTEALGIMTEAELWQQEEADDLDTDSVVEASDEEEMQEEDILSLLNEIPSDDPLSEEARAISELLSGQADIVDDTPTVKEVFSNTLKVVNSLNDLEAKNAAIADVQTEAADEAENKKQKKALKKAKRQEKKEKKAQERIEKKAKKAIDNKESQQSEPEADEEQPVNEQSKRAKKNILQRLFGNVHDEKAAAKKKEMEQQASEDSDKAKEKEKGSLFARLFKRKNAAGGAEGDEQETAGNRRAANAERRRNAKEEKKEKKRRRKEIIEVIDEVEDEGRINRIGASIVFCFFGILALVLFFGTEKVSYSLSIRHATDYFERQKYNEAYNEISGIEPKDEDREIYDRIMTVMYVNKQLNSYNNYYYLGMYPQALDSLLKGIERYDKYIEYATMLGIKSDLDYVRGQILAELENVFSLSDDEIKKLLDIKDAYEYSQEIHKIAQERINN